MTHARQEGKKAKVDAYMKYEVCGRIVLDWTSLCYMRGCGV